MPGPDIQDVLDRIDALETALLDRINAIEWSMEEHCNTGDDGNSAIYGDNWRAEVFTPQHSHKVAYVNLKFCISGSPGNITISIRATDENGKPTGSDLCSKIIDSSSFATSSPGNWETAIFELSPLLEKDIKYAVVVRGLDANISNFLIWRLQSSGTGYTRGQTAKSTNGGVSWSLISSDMMFEEWQNRISGITEINTKLEEGDVEVYTESQHAQQG